jgi:hypothetical protein
MRGINYMEIKVFKKEDNTKVFEIEEKLYEFSYDSLAMIITMFTSNDDEIKYVYDEDLSDYKSLLEKIIEGCRTEDFREALKTANLSSSSN